VREIRRRSVVSMPFILLILALNYRRRQGECGSVKVPGAQATFRSGIRSWPVANCQHDSGRIVPTRNYPSAWQLL
jgi:hypothetical protein